MKPAEFFVLVTDYCNAVTKANAVEATDAEKNMAQNLFLKVRSLCNLYGEQARKKVALQQLKEKLDLKEVKE